MSATYAQLKDNTSIVVFGASGDLAKKKTFPALFGLRKMGLLPKDTRIIGYARSKMTNEEFHDKVTGFIKIDDNDSNSKKLLDEFKSGLSYVAGGYDGEEAFKNLNDNLTNAEKSNASSGKVSNRLFYLALPPSVFGSVSEGLRKFCYSGSGTNRLIVEKPFGKDTESSQQLMNAIKANWSEEEIFRIDHYLGKEMVKNLLVLRFANVFLDNQFHKNSVDNVQITFKEPFGTEGRGGYFDEFNIIRDILQNHLMQVLSLVTMERPVSFSSEDIRDEKVKVLRTIPPLKPEEVVLGQYVGANGKPGYKEDDTVPQDSNCPTYAACALHINNPRWEGVPFILKAGKALNEGKVEVRIQFKDVTSGIFSDIPRDELVIRIQPSEAIYLKANTKVPGLHMSALPTELDLTYKDRFDKAVIPEAYESLLLDALNGDHSNFVRDDELDIAWKIFTPILHWIEGANGEKPTPDSYEYGSRGPKGVEEFQAKFGYKRTPDNYKWPVTDLSQAKM
ncbi:hypothetical protein E3P92_03463 [Wallemia ichthyophaga]|uniref:Glucose-6-phosphate 1-dehydrogenase n=2 Tax=Wallemia ichthyophaga TaxID=245174 RepID=A0A4T0GSA7_WALIC|nr:Glucose-6-phosphate 1-dehydrogenase [Wallemia ichthyophaga EXF-994]TIA71900.1 hypothetical protein E3P91_02285 [Wallemia ichthyophaga]EOR00405.1 Glucose-6-phosphate 1-dehydrogenase [Wallemia ichthyophaga EXF-994]TIA84566.1 hypothetical protein E3P98_00160 [Wallemia ichthyophaga]TIA88638.1 hypothetical protein E3P97_03442 [Wallemia ichthyophaga]TIB04329.1 hypothetical protein E3P95_00191 [Wallemia ichthyophaga]